MSNRVSEVGSRMLLLRDLPVLEMVLHRLYSMENVLKRV